MNFQPVHFLPPHSPALSGSAGKVMACSKGHDFVAPVHALSANLSEASAQPGAWMKVFPAGRTTTRDGRGPFDASDAVGIVERTLRRAGGTELMVDYDHQGHFAAVPGVGGTAKAAGWVKQIIARDDGIYARIEWTAAAKAAIEAGEYRYLSPLFETDPETGAVSALINIALVNMPAFDLAAVAARMDKQETVKMEKIAKALGLAETATGETIAATATALAALAAAARAALGLGDDAKPADISAAAAVLKDGAAGFETVALAAGLTKEATAEIVAATVKTAIAGKENGGENASVIVALKAELAGVTTKFNDLITTIAIEKAQACVDKAIADGKVGFNAAMREHYVRRHAASAQGAKEVEAEIAAAPSLRGTVIVDPLPATGGKVALSAEQKATAKLLGLAEDALLKTIESERTAT